MTSWWPTNWSESWVLHCEYPHWHLDLLYFSRICGTPTQEFNSGVKFDYWLVKMDLSFKFKLSYMHNRNSWKSLLLIEDTQILSLIIFIRMIKMVLILFILMKIIRSGLIDSPRRRSRMWLIFEFKSDFLYIERLSTISPLTD